MKLKIMASIVSIIFAVILFWVLLPKIVTVVGLVVSNYQESTRAHPVAGTYYCQELETFLSFSGSQYTVQYADGSTDLFLVHYAGSFCGATTDFRAFYRWDQGKDQITLTITNFPFPYTGDEKYVFSNIE